MAGKHRRSKPDNEWWLIIRRVARQAGFGGIDAVHDISRVLRVAGSPYRKEGNTAEITLEEVTDTRLDLDSILPYVHESEAAHADRMDPCRWFAGTAGIAAAQIHLGPGGEGRLK